MVRHWLSASMKAPRRPRQRWIESLKRSNQRCTQYDSPKRCAWSAGSCNFPSAVEHPLVLSSPSRSLMGDAVTRSCLTLRGSPRFDPALVNDDGWPIEEARPRRVPSLIRDAVIAETAESWP